MAWTDERVDLLKKLWGDGLSGSQIAGRLGGVTRAAVIAKMHRIGASGRNPSRKQSLSKQQRRTQKPKPLFFARRMPPIPAEPLPPFEELVIPVAERKTVQTLEDNSCRWPIGDPQHEDFHFCGKTKVPGISYCEFHGRRAYQPPHARASGWVPSRVVGLANVDRAKFDNVKEFQDA